MNSKKRRVVFVFLALLSAGVLFVFITQASTPPPNLIVEYTQYVPMPGYAWEPVSFTAYVKNSGDNVAGSSVARLRIDTKSDGTWETVSSVSFFSLAANESRKLEWPDIAKLPPGTHTAEICADADGKVAESDETDNCRSLSLALMDWQGALPGDERALDIVFIGDRYPDPSPFHNDIASLKEYLLSREPFGEFASQIKFHIVENSVYLGCRETIIDLYAPIDPPPTKPTGTATTIMCDQSLVLEAVKKAGVPYDKIVVLASGMYGGTGFGTFVFTGKEKRLFVHELGHGFGLLDEYVSASNSGNASDACHANCCENLRCVAWGSIPGAQCILGCTYPNWYRSSPESIMKSQYAAEYFNAVSIDHLRKTIQRYLERMPPTVNIITPASTAVAGGTVAVTVSASDDMLIAKTEVHIDGNLFAKRYAGEQSVSHQTNWDTTPLAPGSSHVLEAKAYDLAGNVAVSRPVMVTISQEPTASVAPLSVSPSTTPIIQTPSLTQNPMPVISPYPPPLIANGDVLHIIGGKAALYFIKIVGEKRFARMVIGSTLLLYPHLKPPYAKELYLIAPIPVSTNLYAHAGYRLSAWIRLPVTPDPETWKVWEVNDDGTKHWITCADPNNCASIWLAHGGDPDGIYTVNKAELDFYQTGPNVFLR